MMAKLSPSSNQNLAGTWVDYIIMPYSDEEQEDTKKIEKLIEDKQNLDDL